MEKNTHVFIPAAGPPTLKKIQKITLILIGVMTVMAIGCSAVAVFSKSKPGDLVFIFCVYILLCLFVIAVRFTIRYIVEIQIDPVGGLLYASFMNHKGEIVKTKINVKQAKYSYKLRASNVNRGYTLTLRDNDSRLQIDETKSQDKNLTNVFFRSQLDEINELILQIKG